MADLQFFTKISPLKLQYGLKYETLNQSTLPLLLLHGPLGHSHRKFTVNTKAAKRIYGSVTCLQFTWFSAPDCVTAPGQCSKATNACF